MGTYTAADDERLPFKRTWTLLRYGVFKQLADEDFEVSNFNSWVELRFVRQVRGPKKKGCQKGFFRVASDVPADTPPTQNNSEQVNGPTCAYQR